MKKRSFLGVILLTLTMLFIPNYVVKADSAFEFKCDNTIANGEIVECKLEYAANNTGKINSVRGALELSSTFTLDHFEFHELFDQRAEANSANLNFTAVSNSGVPTSDTILKVYVKANVKADGKTSDQIKLRISTVDGTISPETNANLTSNVIKLEIKDENRLSSLTVSSGTLSPSFNSDILEYSLTTGEEELTLTPKTKDSLATVEINGKKASTISLEYGENDVNIKVIAQDGSVKTYKLSVIRKDNRNDNAKLQLLSVDGKKISLKDNNYNYTVDVSYETEDANLLYAASSSTSTVEVSGDEKLKVGENSIIITVTSEKGTTQKYYLTINRLNEIKSDDSSIKKLEILNVDNLDFNFKSDNHNYMIKLPKNVDELKFNIELNDPKAEYKITGNENLENYSKVLIKVTAEDESSTTYSFLIEKKESNNLMLILIILIVILVALIIGIILVVKNRNKNNKNDKKPKENINNNEKSKLVDNITMNEPPKKDENNMIVFTDPDEEKEDANKEEPKEESIDLEKEDTKEFVIKRPANLENPVFEDDKIKLENPEFTEKDINNEENPNFE